MGPLPAVAGHAARQHRHACHHGEVGGGGISGRYAIEKLMDESMHHPPGLNGEPATAEPLTFVGQHVLGCTQRPYQPEARRVLLCLLPPGLVRGGRGSSSSGSGGGGLLRLLLSRGIRHEAAPRRVRLTLGEDRAPRSCGPRCLRYCHCAGAGGARLAQKVTEQQRSSAQGQHHRSTGHSRRQDNGKWKYSRFSLASAAPGR
jgi:hypothetical protein